MKKLHLIILILIISSCSGYKPIFSSKDINFFINEITIPENDRISFKIKKKLKPYTLKETNRDEININIESYKKLNIIAKDNKGDASMFNLIVISNINLLSDNILQKNYKFTEKFTFKNQENKFELEQYKTSLENELIDKIFEKLILNLRTR